MAGERREVVKTVDREERILEGGGKGCGWGEGTIDDFICGKKR